MLTSSPSPSDIKFVSPRSLPKKKFSNEDDAKLQKIINEIGTQSWTQVAKAMGDRNPRQCKERWENYLNPAINTSPWTQEEDDLLIQKQLEIGSKWVTIAHFFNHRTDAQVKNRWQMLARKMKKMRSRQQKSYNVSQQTIQPVQVRMHQQIPQNIIELQNFNSQEFNEFKDEVEEISYMDFDFNSTDFLFGEYSCF